MKGGLLEKEKSLRKSNQAQGKRKAATEIYSYVKWNSKYKKWNTLTIFHHHPGWQGLIMYIIKTKLYCFYFQHNCNFQPVLYTISPLSFIILLKLTSPNSTSFSFLFFFLLVYSFTSFTLPTSVTCMLKFFKTLISSVKK